MSEFSTGFSFDLQRFAKNQTFKSAFVGDEAGVTLSELFNAQGKAWLAPKDASSFTGDTRFFWEKSALVELNPASDNAKESSVAGAIQIVAGKYDDAGTLGTGEAGYIIKSVTAIDARELTGSATFKNIGNTTILNPGKDSTINIGGTELTFGGTNQKDRIRDATYGYTDVTVSGGASKPWDVGTKINTSNNSIKNVEAGVGENITTADEVSVDFEKGGTATFSGKSFDTVTTFVAGDSAVITVDGGDKIVLEAEADMEEGVTDGAIGITATFSGQAVTAIDFNSKTDTADVAFGGSEMVATDIAIQKGTVNVANIAGASTSKVSYHYSSDGNNVLDLTTATAATNNNKTLDVAVSKTGNAKFLLATDIDNNSEKITIGGTDYTFTDIGSNGGVFMVSNNAVTGFVFRDAGDSITVPAGSKFKFYNAVSSGSSTSDNLGENAANYATLDVTNLEEVTFEVTGTSEYTVTKLADDRGYEIEVYNGAEVVAGGATIGFTLPTTKPNKKTAPTSAKITISNDGVLQSITAGNNAAGESEGTSFDVGGTNITFSGMNSDSVSENFSIGGVKFATGSGTFNYLIEGEYQKASTETQAFKLNSTDDTITRMEKADDVPKADDVQANVILAETKSEGDEEPAGYVNYLGVEYNYSSPNGKAYLGYDSASTIVKFIFVDEGDTINIPDTGNIDLYFKNNLKGVADDDKILQLDDYPKTDGDSYSITMTKATTKKNGVAEFELFGIEADDKVSIEVTPATEEADAVYATFEFSADGGKFLFTSANVATGFTAASGTVTMNAEAAAYLAQAEGADAFEIDGTPVNITATPDTNGEIVYDKTDKSLAGFASDAIIADAGAITKIYAVAEDEGGTFTFGTGDDAKQFESQSGDLQDETRAYFTVDRSKATGFTFLDTDDEITGSDFSDFTFTDAPSGNTFAAPVVTKEDEPARVTIMKTEEDYDNDRDDDPCYAVMDPEDDDWAYKTVTFADGTKLTFNDAQAATEVLFDNKGVLISILNLDEANNEVAVEGATAPVFIDDKEIDIEGGGFIFTMLDEDTPAITDVIAGTRIIKAANVAGISTAGGSLGIGDFTFGNKVFSVAGDENDGVLFSIDSDINVTGVSGVKGNESVTGALNGLALNGGASVLVSGGTDDIYTFSFSGTSSFAGLNDGDSVTNAGDMTDFITEGEGAFNILGTSMAIAGDSTVTFQVAGGSVLSTIAGLSGIAIGDFTNALQVNNENETVHVTGDTSVAVTGNDNVVTRIANVSGSVALEEIGSASQVATDGNGVFDFVEAGQKFATRGSSDGVVFGIDGNDVVSIEGLNLDGEAVTSDFSEGITVDGNLVQVDNGGVSITVINGSHSGYSGVGIYGLKDGAVVGAASGISVAVLVEETGSVTFNNGTFAVAGDSNGHVGFALDGAGNVTSIFNVDENATVTGPLDGISVNNFDDPLDIKEDNSNISYNPTKGISGVVDGNTVASADGASSVFVAGTDFTVTFGEDEFTVAGESDGVTFKVTDKNKVVGIEGLAADATLEGALSGVTAVNGASFGIQNDPEFAIVGAESGISRIENLSGSAVVANAGGASIALTDEAGNFTFGEQQFNVVGDSAVQFDLDEDGKVVNVAELNGIVESEDFTGVSVNGQSFAVTGDDGVLAVVGNDDGILAFDSVGGADVTVENAGGAQLLFTDKAGKITFAQSGQSFSTEDDEEVGYILDEQTGAAVAVGLLDGSLTGNFNNISSVNGKEFDVVDSDDNFTVTGMSGISSIAKISGIDGGAILNNVGGVSQVVTATEGSFSFAGNSMPFVVSNDDSVTFEMDADEAAKVVGISDFGGDAVDVTGALDGVAINGASLAVAGDSDGQLGYSIIGDTKLLYNVAGDSVAITATGDANNVLVSSSGAYAFPNQAYNLEADGALFSLDEDNVNGIMALSGAVTGDFSTEGFEVNGKGLEITGDTSIKVTADLNGATLIENFSDSAKIVAAEGVSLAIADSEGTFEDASGRKITIDGDSAAVFQLDGHGNFVGLSVADDAAVSGNIAGLSFNGREPVSVISAPDGEPNTDLTYVNGVLGGVLDGDTVISADGATLVAAEGAGDDTATYQFGVDDDAQRFSLEGGENVVFTVRDGNKVTAAAIEEDATLTGELNGIAVNGNNVSIIGDSVYGAIGSEDGLKAVDQVGDETGNVTVVSAGGAGEIRTNGEGLFTFDKSGQSFFVDDDKDVTFGIDENESVTAIDELDGVVSGDFRNEIAVNGQAVQVTGDTDGIDVVGGEDGTVVEKLDDVDAGATVVSSGGASVVGASGEGVFTFAESGDKFTVAGDDEIDFTLDDGDVTGATKFTSGKLTFSADQSPQLSINPTVNDDLFTNSADDVTVTVDEEGKIVQVEGIASAYDEDGNLVKHGSVNGLEDATVKATGDIYVNDKHVVIDDADDKFDVVVSDSEFAKVTGVTGDATIEVEDGLIETDADGKFVIGGASYTIADEDGKVGLTTDSDGDLTAVSSLEGSIVVQGNEAITVNDNYVELDSDEDAITIASNGTNISVTGLVDGDAIKGDLDNASIAVSAVDADGDGQAVLDVNDTTYILLNAEDVAGGTDTHYEDGAYVGDADGITVNGANKVVGLDADARMLVDDAGTYTVNGSVINALAGDTIIGADNGAYLYDADNILVRKSTPLAAIESIAGIPSHTIHDNVGSASAPLTKEELDEYFADDTTDLDRPLKIYTTYPDAQVDDDPQEIDLSDTKFTKHVHLFDGPQAVAFNDEGGNLAHVEGTASGEKAIVLGDGGDVVVVDEGDALGNEVAILGGAGADTVFVRNNVTTTFDMSEGGADKVVTFAGANARIKLDNYDPTTGAGVKFDQDETRNIASAINNGVLDFGDGVISLTTASGNTQVSLSNTDSVGGSLVNLFTPEGKKQAVGFTHSAGTGDAAVDASTWTDDVILIGNFKGNKQNGASLLGGAGNDTIFGGEGDSINGGAGNDHVTLEDDKNRKGAFINIAAGTTVIENMNNTLDEIHGDTLGVDLTQMELTFDGTNLIAKGTDADGGTVLATVLAADKDGDLSYDLASSADEAEDTAADETSDSESSVAADTTPASTPLVADHNYTNQIINSNGDIWKAAIGAEGSVIDVKLDEDVRANYYKGENSGLTFGSYNGDVLIDLNGDWQETSTIDDRAVVLEGINRIQAGTGLNYLKGSDENETFFAGRGNSHLYGDGGKNLLVGYEGTDKEGQTTFYVLGNAAGAANSIQAFDFVDDDNYTNNNRITADKIEVDLPTNVVSRVDLSGDNVVMEVTKLDGSATESVVIEGAKGNNVLVNGDGLVADVVAQVGDDELTFDKFANYYNATGKNAVVTVKDDQDTAAVWLDNVERTGKTFVGDIHGINAQNFSGTAELAGNDYDNAIIAGSGSTSLWGGNRGDDLLIAGTGANTFYYTLGNGTDTILGAKDGDVVNLAGVNIDDIVGAEFSGSGDPIQGVALNFSDGGKLYIGDNGTNNVSYVVNGDTYIVNSERNGFEKKA